MSIFEDLRTQGKNYGYLSEQGLINKLFLTEALYTLNDLGWEIDINFEDEKLLSELQELSIYIIFLDPSKTDITKDFVESYEPLKNHHNSDSHNFNFIIVDCISESMAGFGLGRKNRPFCLSSFEGKNFEQGLTKFGEKLPLDLTKNFLNTILELSNALFNMDNTPGNPETLETLLDEDADHQNLYWIDGYSEGFTKEEIENYLFEFRTYQDEYYGSEYCLQAFFPDLDARDLSTGDY